MRKNSGSTLFLMEMLAVILFFALSAAVCMRVFAAARLESEYAARLSLAAARAQTAAECYKAAGGSVPYAADLFGTEADGNSFSAAYDSNMHPCDENCAEYLLTLTAEKGTAHIAVTDTDTGEELFAISAAALMERGSAE